MNCFRVIMLKKFYKKVDCTYKKKYHDGESDKILWKGKTRLLFDKNICNKIFLYDNIIQNNFIEDSVKVMNYGKDKTINYYDCSINVKEYQKKLYANSLFLFIWSVVLYDMHLLSWIVGRPSEGAVMKRANLILLDNAIIRNDNRNEIVNLFNIVACEKLSDKEQTKFFELLMKFNFEEGDMLCDEMKMLFGDQMLLLNLNYLFVSKDFEKFNEVKKQLFKNIYN